MTTPSPGGHPPPEDLDLLLEAEEAAVGDAQRATTAGHVAACAQCAATVREMAWVRDLLRAEAERTPPLPADLPARLAAALDAERSLPAPAPSPGPAADVVPLRRRPAGVPRWLAAAAGLVLLGGAAAAATELLAGGDGAAVMSGGAESTGEQGASGGAPEARAPVGVPVLQTGEDYTADRLDEQVRGLIAAAEAGPPAEALDNAGTATLDAPVPQGAEGAEELAGGAEGTRLAAPDALAGCLEAIGAAGATPQAVDLATFDGRQVAVIVLPGNGARSQVWVVDPGCRPGADGLVHYQVVTP